MNIAFSLADHVVSNIIIIFFLDLYLTPKWRFTTNVAVLSLLVCITSCLLTHLPEKERAVTDIILTAAALAFLIGFSYADSRKRKLTVLCVQIFLYLISKLISCLLAWGIFGFPQLHSFEAEKSQELLSMSRILCIDIFFILSLSVIIIVNHRHLIPDRSPGLLYLMLTICVMHFLFLLLYYRLGRTPEYEINDGLQILLQLMIFTPTVFHYFSTLRVSQLERNEAEIEHLNEELKNNRLYFELADSKFEEISRIRHDIQNELSTAKFLIEKEDSIESAKSIIDSIQHRLDRI